jgi:mycothiol synthase
LFLDSFLNFRVCSSFSTFSQTIFIDKGLMELHHSSQPFVEVSLMFINKPVPFSLSTAGDDQISAWYDLNTHCRRDVLPEEPDISLSNLFSEANALNETRVSREWAIWDTGNRKMIGLGSIDASKSGFDEGSATFYILIRSDFRRLGLGRSFLSLIADTAKSHDWDVLKSYSNSRCSAGSEFLKGTGAETISEGHFNRLVLSEVNRDVIEKWAGYPDESSIRIQIGEWEGLFPDDRIKEISDFYQAVFDAMNRKLQYSPETVRRDEKTALYGDRKRLIVFATDSDSGKLLGLTEIRWSPSRPSILSQCFTAVIPEARGMGIGRRLKAEMLFRIVSNFESAECIMAGNDADNAPIQKINQELGFRHFFTNYTWKIETDALIKYLESSKT